MKRILATVAIAAAILFALAVPVIMTAQDATENPPTDVAPTAESTVEVTPEPTPTPAPPVVIINPATAAELLLFMGLSMLAGGGLVAIILSFLGKKEVRDRVEEARESWSPDQKKMLEDFTGMFERTTTGILDFLKAVQDGRPNTPPNG